MRAATLMLVILALLIVPLANASAPTATGPEPIYRVLSESGASITIDVTIPTPTVKVLDREGAGKALSVEIPGVLPDYDQNGVISPSITKLVQVPPGKTVAVTINHRDFTDYDAGTYVPRDAMERVVRDTDAQFPLIEVGKPGWLRSIRVVPIIIRPVSYDPESNKIQVVDQAEVKLDFVSDGTTVASEPSGERYWSQAFEDYYQANVLNYTPRNILPGGQMVARGSYVVITDDTLSKSSLDMFSAWKKDKGFNFVVWNWWRPAVTAQQIRDSLQVAYDTWSRPPEFFLILGDVNYRDMHIPAFMIRNINTNEDNVTDLPYSLLAGDDYFPDIFVGRISADTPSNTIALNGLTRSVKHEMNIGSFQPARFHRATLFAGNYAAGANILSPVETCIWLQDRLTERGWNVEGFYWRNGEDNQLPAPIVRSINRGVNIVAYRGWGDANGTHYPQFYRGNFESLTNAPLLPIFTFFVCNTGDYGNEYVNPCFGEAAIQRGSINTPKGALGFLGPSDLHTSTPYNNALFAGYYYSLLYQKQRVMGALALSSKMELWRVNPLIRGVGDWVHFYFGVYNTLADPEVSVFLDPPTQLRVTHPQNLYQGESNFRITVRDTTGAGVKGALVHLRNPGALDVSILTDADGEALIPISLASTDSVRLTVIGFQLAPYRAVIPVSEPQAWIGFASASVTNNQNGLVAGTPLEVAVSLKNFGVSAANGVVATLTSPVPEVTIQAGPVAFGTINAGATVAGQTRFPVSLDPAMEYRTEVPFVLDIRDDAGHQYPALFRLKVVSNAMAFRGVTVEDVGADMHATRAVAPILHNDGAIAVAGLTARISSFDGSIVIDDSVATFGDVAANDFGNCTNDPFHVSFQQGTTVGRQIPLRMQLFDGQNREIGRLYFNITAGNRTIADPVGPDGYGYFAYDDGDAAYASHPAFNWIELDPHFGGAVQGAGLMALKDDSTSGIALPFPFKFYGQEFRSVSVCSNGWMSFENTDAWDFFNWPLPSPLGPHAIVAPYWDDLVGQRIAGGRDSLRIYYKSLTNPNRFVVEWSRVVARNGVDQDVTETFEVVLFDPAETATHTGDGNILFQYLQAQNVDNGFANYASAGIEDWHHGRGLGLTFASMYSPGCDTLRNNRAILITTNPPDGFEPTNPEEVSAPVEFGIREAWPNPFNSRTSISYGLLESGEFKLALFDLTGREVALIDAGSAPAGWRSATLDAGSLPSGLYMVKLSVQGRTSERKIVLLK